MNVSEPSRIYATGGGFFDPGDGTANDAEVDVQLRDASDTVTLADSGTVGESADAPANGVSNLDSANVLLTSPSLASAYTGAPGTYVLRLEVTPAGACGAIAYFFDMRLSYILLGTTP